WDLMESCGVFSDEERARIANVLLKILRSDQGLQYVAARGTLRSRENHSTRSARAFYFGWRHFHKYYGELLEGETDIWRDHLENFWRSPFASARSFEDSISQHALGGSLDNTLDIAMMEPEWASDWLASGRAKTMGERCLAICNNQGECVLSGDTNPGDYPGSPFAKLAWILKDGRYQFMLGKRGGRGISSDEPLRGFYAGIQPTPPADHLPLHAVPADKLFFQTGLRRTGRVKLENAFDKLTIRSGFAPDDEYMLIDGTAGGSHSYDDANTICEYSANARRWLCQIDIFNGPTMSFHNAVTVARKGLGEADVPQAAELVRSEKLGEHAVYVATRLPEYNGMDWTRHIIWLKGRFTYVLDELTAREEDDYSCVLGWRSLGKPTLTPGRFTSSQDELRTVGAAWGGDVLVGMISDTSGQHTRCISSHNALFSRTDAAGQFVELKLPIRAAVNGRLEITTLDFAGRGIVQVVLNGEPVGKPIDMFHPGSPRRTAHDLGPVKLAAGTHTVRLQIVGRNPQSDNHNLGVLQLAVRKGGPAEETITPNRFALLFPPSVPSALDRDTETLGSYLPISPHRDQALNILEQSAGAHLKPGQSLCFQNVFYAAKGKQPEVEYRRVDSHTALVRWNGELMLLAAGGERQTPTIASSLPGSPHQNLPREKLERMWKDAASVQTTKIDEDATPKWTANLAMDLPSPPLSLESWSSGKTAIIAIGYASGLVELRTPQGNVLATFRTGGPVHTLCASDLDGDGHDELLVGSDDEHVYALAADGTLEWKTKIPFHRKEQPWLWWTLGSSKVRKIHAADLDGDGLPEILVGAGNMRLQCLDNTGKELWRFRTDHGICDTITSADLFGEGTLRVIAGNGLTSDQGTCRIFDEQGTQLQTYWNEGWCTSLPAVATADLNGDGKLTLFCGNNRGNLRAYPPKRGRRVKPLWTRNLTRPIRSLTPLRTPQGGCLAVGSDSGTLVAFDIDGKSVWTAQLGSAILATAETNTHELVAGCKNGELFLLDGNGTLRRRAHPFARLVAIHCANGTLLAAGTTPPRLVVFSTR
ncbi:MAG: VCBS repeat-containing protein, partial [Lentisphaeria bacterium]|nr:VCBS repeat-containing protein [Lentisphaeria bacterium]